METIKTTARRISGAKYFDYALCAVIGFFVFVLIYGFIPLDVTRDDWLLNGYIEKDVLQSYAGWLSYRHTPWQFPLCFTPQLGAPNGTVIAYTDSIPLFAIFFKLLSPILPATFQYHGWYNALCFVVTAFSSCLLMKQFTQKKSILYLFSALMAFSPILIERAFRHTALASHWFIILALYCYFKSYHQGGTFQKLYILLAGLSVAIHPYFTPMVFAILCANMLNIMLRKKTVLKPLGFILLCAVPVLVVGWAIGLFVPSVASTENWYGYFSMNLNALINPVSINVVTWSQVFRAFPQILGNYDGFNYLGLGVLLFLFFIAVFLLVKTPAKEILPRARQKVVALGQNHLGLIIACLILFLFSIGNIIAFNDHILVELTLPELVARVFSIFRGNSRMFYPIYYLIFTGVVLYLARNIPQKSTMLVAVLVAVQVWDISPALAGKHELYEEATIQYVYQNEVAHLYTPQWDALAEEHEFLSLLNPQGFPYELAVYAGKHQLPSNLMVANRGSFLDLIEKREEDLALLRAGGLPNSGTLYLLNRDEALEAELAGSLHSDLGLYDLGAYCAVLPKAGQPPFSPVSA